MRNKRTIEISGSVRQQFPFDNNTSAGWIFAGLLSLKPGLCLRHGTHRNLSVKLQSQSSSAGEGVKGLMLRFLGIGVVVFSSKWLNSIQIKHKTNGSWRPRSNVPITKRYKKRYQRREFNIRPECPHKLVYGHHVEHLWMVMVTERGAQGL